MDMRYKTADAKNGSAYRFRRHKDYEHDDSDRGVPLVSVIIPCYNQAHYLVDAIESALAQTHPRVQIVVVDDGSVDNTAEVALHYPDVCFVRQPNQGLGNARNAGFRSSSGEYVAFLDADDRLRPTAAETHLQCFAEHPEAAFVVGDIDLIGADGSYLRSPRWPELASNQYEQLLKVDHVANTIAVMFAGPLWSPLAVLKDRTRRQRTTIFFFAWRDCSRVRNIAVSLRSIADTTPTCLVKAR
jgi:glycosyltransferase involved in cell wall biosynthesis